MAMTTIGRTCRIKKLRWEANQCSKNMCQYDRPRILACELVDQVLVVPSSNQINIATFVHQMGHTYLPSGEQHKNIYLI